MTSTPMGTALNVALVVTLAAAGTTLGTVLYFGDDCETHATTGLDYEVCGPSHDVVECAGAYHAHAWERTKDGGVRRITTDVAGFQVAVTRLHCHGVLVLDGDPGGDGDFDVYGADCPDGSTPGYAWVNNQFVVGCGDVCPDHAVHVDATGKPWRVTIPCIIKEVASA